MKPAVLFTGTRKIYLLKFLQLDHRNYLHLFYLSQTTDSILLYAYFKSTVITSEMNKSKGLHTLLISVLSEMPGNIIGHGTRLVPRLAHYHVKVLRGSYLHSPLKRHEAQPTGASLPARRPLVNNPDSFCIYFEQCGFTRTHSILICVYYNIFYERGNIVLSYL